MKRRSSSSKLNSEKEDGIEDKRQRLDEPELPSVDQQRENAKAWRIEQQRIRQQEEEDAAAAAKAERASITISTAASSAAAVPVPPRSPRTKSSRTAPVPPTPERRQGLRKPRESTSHAKENDGQEQELPVQPAGPFDQVASAAVAAAEEQKIAPAPEAKAESEM